jgi:hypothetical protein
MLVTRENQKPETRNQKPETRNQKPETRNQKPETKNPTLGAWGFSICRHSQSAFCRQALGLKVQSETENDISVARIG